MSKYLSRLCLRETYCLHMITALLLSAILMSSCNRGIPTETIDQNLPAKQIASMTLPAQELWRKPQTSMLYGGMSAGMEATQYYLSYFEQEEDKLHVIVLDTRTGERIRRFEDIPYPHSMFMHEDYLYLAVNWNILAWNLSTGELNWESEDLRDHTGYQIHPAPLEDNILVYSTETNFFIPTQLLRYYNRNDGELVELITIRIESDSGFMFFRSPQVDYWIGDGQLWAVNFPDMTTLWRVDMNNMNRVSGWPIVHEQRLIVALGTYPTIQAYDTTTGALVWEYNEKLLSNIVVMDGVLYALRTDGVLVTLDANSGTALGSVTFAPFETQSGPRSKAYWIGASAGRIFVYFGDSQELVAIRIHE